MGRPRSRGPVWVRLLPRLLLLGVLIPGPAAAQEPAAPSSASQLPAPSSPPLAQAPGPDQLALDAAIKDAGRSAGSLVKTEPPGYDLSGYLSLTYSGRVHSGDNDEDLYGYLSINGGHAEVDDVTFHLFARASYDLDGDEDHHENPFNSLNDVYGNQFDGHLYEAYAELRRSLAPEFLGIEMIRLGRQAVTLEYSYLVDGLRLDFARIQSAGNLGISVYGGVPESLYDRSISGQWIAGVDVNLRPLDRTHIDLRYAHIEDHAAWIDGDQSDDFAVASIHQGLGENGTASAEWTTVDARTHNVAFRLGWEFPDIDLSLHGAYRYQVDVEEEFTTELDPYVGVLGPSYAYHQMDLEADKLFGENFGVDGGFSARLLDDDGHEGPFNREYVRGWLTFSTFKWPVPEMDFALTGEIWDADQDDTATAGFDVTYRATPDLRFSTGTYYSLYKYDLFVVEERQDATTIFLKARWKFAEGFRLDGRYEFETGDDGVYHSFWLTLTWTF